MTDIAGFVDTRAATRLANAIGTLKPVLLGLIAIGTALGWLADDSVLTAFVLLCGAVAFASVYVVFGCFEHTLLLLAAIARNTAPGGGVPPDLED